MHDKSRAARFVAAKRAACLDAAGDGDGRVGIDASDEDAAFWRFGTRDLNAGDVLITRGARAKEAFVIDSGCVEILVEDEALDEELKVAERGVGDVVGEMGVTTDAGGDVDEAKYDERERQVPRKTPSGRTLRDADPLVAKPSRERGLETRDGERVFRAFATLATLLRVKRVWFGAQYRRMLAEDYDVDVERKRMLEARTEETMETVRRASFDVVRPAVSAS